MAERTTSAEDTQNQHCQCVHTNVDRGRQQKRIGRQPLQSSSISAAAAAAAVAAAGTEAAWRGLDRVHEHCWQMIERALLGGGAGDDWAAGRVRRLGSAWLARLRWGSDGRP